MSGNTEDRQDANVPEQAVKALTAAHQRALAARRTLVLVRNGQLVRVTSTGSTVLRPVQGRMRVTVRTKMIRR